MELRNFIKCHKRLFMRLMDIFVIIIAYVLVEVFKSETFFIFLSSNKQIFTNTVLLGIVVYQIFLSLFDCYKSIIRYESGKDYLIYGLACMVSCVIVSMLSSIFDIRTMEPKFNLLAGVLIAVMMTIYRFTIRLFLTDTIVYRSEIMKANDRKNLLIIGVGTVTRDIIQIIKSTMQKSYNIVGIIDDDKNKINYAISGVRILGDRSKIKEACKEYKVDIIFFAISEISNQDKKEMLDICHETGVEVRILPSIEDIISNLYDVKEEKFAM